MSALSAHEITRLLQEWHGGDQAAFDQLLPLVYDELRRLAKNYMHRQKPGHTLQTTALINEAYLRLVHLADIDWQSRAHFFAVAAQAMRYLLRDRARAKKSARRAGARVTLDEAAQVSVEYPEEALALDEALTRLAALDPRQSRIVELRYFGGLTVEETAEVLGISPATVMREWAKAKGWLYRELSPRQPDDA